jgi:hypothetical protein
MDMISHDYLYLFLYSFFEVFFLSRMSVNTSKSSGPSRSKEHLMR